jgi:short-subunit dehydrogenase
VATGQTIVVTGASSGIGRELAIQMAGPGREMWLVGRDAGRLDEVAGKVREKGGNPHIVRMDLADIKSAAAFLAETFPPDKSVDEVYLSAAVTMFGEVKDTLPEDWDRIYQTNLMSPVQWILHFYSNMVKVKSGKIIIISSLAAYGGYPTAVAYATMKAGLLGLFRSLLHEGRAHGVGIHLAAPGYVDTSIYKTAIFRNTSYEKIMVQIRSLGFRVITAESAARTILARVARGEAQFALPAYASVMKWTAPRFPAVIDFIHAKIVRSFRQAS